MGKNLNIISKMKLWGERLTARLIDCFRWNDDESQSQKDDEGCPGKDAGSLGHSG
jgi:hypothetical protein